MLSDYAKGSGNGPRSGFSAHVRSAFVQDQPSAPNNTLAYAECFNSAWLALLPPDAMSSAFDCGTTIKHPAFPSSSHRSLIFSIANNFAGLEGVPKGVILKSLAKYTHMHSLLKNYLHASPVYVCKSLAENLIRAAIENYDATLVTALLSTGLATPDEIVCPFKGRRYTAIERSAMLQSTEVTKALLVAGADVNKTYFGMGSLALAIRSRGTTEPVDIQLVELLLECGAEVCLGSLHAAFSEKDPILVRSLTSKLSSFQYHEFLKNHYETSTLIEEAIRKLDCELATGFVTNVLKACYETGCGKCPKPSKAFKTSISIAAMKGFSVLVIRLLEYTHHEDLPLAAAVRSSQKELIEVLLREGADVNAAASSMGSDKHLAYTPLAEAIRGGNEELLRDFESRGALSHIREGGRFRAATYAAAEVGNIAYAEKLLQMSPDIPPDQLDLALEISIKEGDDKLALRLLRAGADVNVCWNPNEDGSYTTKNDVASLIALRQRNETLALAVMDCSMRLRLNHHHSYDSPLLLAARWGNLCVIRGLLLMGADVDGEGEVDDAQMERVNINNGEYDDDDEDDDNNDDFYRCLHDELYMRETAVTAAVKRSNKLLVELLVCEYQASLNLYSDRKTSPLAAAISRKDIDMLRYLLELGGRSSM